MSNVSLTEANVDNLLIIPIRMCVIPSDYIAKVCGDPLKIFV